MVAWMRNEIALRNIVSYCLCSHFTSLPTGFPTHSDNEELTVNGPLLLFFFNTVICSAERIQIINLKNE